MVFDSFPMSHSSDGQGGLISTSGLLCLKVELILGHSQNHLAVAGGCCAAFSIEAYGVPTRYREVVLTVSKKLTPDWRAKDCLL
jgi:hypothetical protein